MCTYFSDSIDLSKSISLSLYVYRYVYIYIYIYVYTYIIILNKYTVYGRATSWTATPSPTATPAAWRAAYVVVE